MNDHSSVQVDLLLETGGGGSGRHVIDLYTGLRERGWDARLVLSAVRMDNGFAAELAELPDEHLTFLKLRRTPHITDLAAITRLKRNIRCSSRRYLLHAHSTKAGMLGWALRGCSAGRILTPHAYRGMDPNLSGYRRTIIRRAESLFSRSFDAVIAVSEEEHVYGASLGIEHDDLYHIPNGVYSERILALNDCVRSQVRRTGPVLGFIGRLVYQKHPLLFLQVLGLLVARGIDATAHIIGDGPLMPYLKKSAVELNIADRINWRGACIATAELSNMDILVHTSVYESSPYSLLEAIAADIPVVAVGNAGSRSIFGELLPEAVEPNGSAESLAKAVQTVLQNGVLQERYRTQYKQIKQRFSADRMIDRTIAIYESVLTKTAFVDLRNKRLHTTNQLGAPAESVRRASVGIASGGPSLSSHASRNQ